MLITALLSAVFIDRGTNVGTFADPSHIACMTPSAVAIETTFGSSREKALRNMISSRMCRSDDLSASRSDTETQPHELSSDGTAQVKRPGIPIEGKAAAMI
jgi:hypothetical protein